MDENNKTSKRDDKGSWAVGGGLMLGLGAGFFLLKLSALYFVGCILAGLGLGLIVAAIIRK
jgi:hypothetical protein